MKKDFFYKILEKNVVLLPTPSFLKYSWNFGSMISFVFLVQVFSGIFLSIYYSPSLILAFQNYVFMSKNFGMGFFLKVVHSNGVSLFFILVYYHMFRGMMNLSFKNFKMWNSGVFILLLLMVISFLGYVLPWGQMSLWGATVICNVLSSIPFVGGKIVFYLWGDFTVSQPTLNRFFTFHFSFSFLLFFFVFVHLVILHEKGSTNNLMIFSGLDKVVFKKFFVFKDLVTLVLLFFFYLVFCNSDPLFFLDSENFNPANFLVTPVHIMPEWYFLFAYAMLRSVPNKLGGVVVLFFSIFSLFFLGIFNKVGVSKFSFKVKVFGFLKFDVFLVLTFLGMKEIEEPYLSMGLFFTFLYFIVIFI